MILLEFMFQGPFHFIGCLILVVLTYGTIENVAKYISRIFSGRE